MSDGLDIIIVGAGIVGAACAVECAKGGLRVLVVDRGPVGGGTTGAGMGHLVVMDDSEAQFALTNYSRMLWRQLAPDLPNDVDYDPCGTLWVAADEQEMQEVKRKQEFYSQRDVRVEVLDAPALSKAEPNLRPGLAGGLRVPDDAVVYPPCAAAFLMHEAQHRGAKLRRGMAVRDVRPSGEVVLLDGSRISAEIVVIAAGPWSETLAPGVPVRKRKGHLLITDRYPGFVHHQIIELGYLKSAHSTSADSVAFNIQPRKNGQMLIGSSRQFEADDGEINQPILDRMLNRALEYLPSLSRLSAIRAWTGHRAATPDKLPLIGPSLECDRIWLATGHEGLGITTALGTAKLLADLLLNHQCEIPPEPYSPDRFAGRIDLDE
ncbi:MAG TPA: FAD-dependent oxidoreductase [Candidatus Limnocylindrales bacterium]|jgi:glycine/D-amino acid oxidase-like deaminating enzyme|nr:FAD-dependent oxidoreductase [Candidatus Limnocylindrales bacterium]